MRNDEQEKVIIKSKRKFIDIAGRKVHVETWQKSGMTMSQYCRQHSLALASFSSWAKKVREPNTLFKQLISPASQTDALRESPSGVVEIIFDQRIKIRFINTINAGLVVETLKELVKCN